MVPTERAPPHGPRADSTAAATKTCKTHSAYAAPYFDTHGCRRWKTGARNSPRMRPEEHRIESEAMFGNQMNN